MIDTADPEQLMRLLRRHRVDPKHSLGQNFLVDAVIRDRVADAAGVTQDDDVLEVGAGAGSLTIALAPRCRRLVAVEIDRRLAAVLREVLGSASSVEVVQADILKLDIAMCFPHGVDVVTGNIPYNLTGALIRKLLDDEPRPRRLSLVVQKEVAERWTASTGASLSTVAVQVFAEPRLAFTVPAAAFSPQPRVESACVVLEVRRSPAVDVDDLDAFFRLVEAVFQLRRKQLGGTLGRISDLGSTAAAARLREAGIDPERRPQTLTLAEWQAVYEGFARVPHR
jgi:16S rRNA (adenine1518-N6/adenine1519-N6)-dimethyltransferase